MDTLVLPHSDDPLAEHTTLGVASGLLNLPQGIIDNNPLLPIAIKCSLVQVSRRHKSTQATAIVAWGVKKSRKRAVLLAKKHNLPLITLEDGFIRSLDSGINSRYGVSYVVDDIGIYFNTHSPNRLENLIITTVALWQDIWRDCAYYLMDKLLNNQLSKYNPPNAHPLPTFDRPILLIIDQVKGDASVSGANASESDFLAMVQYAKHYPNHTIVIKTHPAGKGYLSSQRPTQNQDNLIFLDKNVNAISLLKQADIVLTVSSHMGFEALLLGKSVHLFGVAWYAGFGLTIDDYIKDKLTSILARRGQIQASVCQLFFASYVLYSRYADPATMTACDMDIAMDYLIRNRQHAKRLQNSVLIYQFSRWKIPFMRRFLQTPFNQLSIQKKPTPSGFKKTPQISQTTINKTADHIIAWGHTNAQSLRQNTTNATIWCCEDGFIRSQGLGASLIAPLSIVLDSKGIYYNANTPSDLEILLKTITLSPQQLQQATQVHNALLVHQLSKYNVGQNTHFLTALQQLKKQKPHAKIRLLVGQVEDDASIAKCLSTITTNQALLADVRQRHPNDIIIYKPHPDVEANLRPGKIDPTAYADITANNTPIFACIKACDTLHTISSQAGFEALLQHKQVVCYGLPFYAGFGLTCDLSDNPKAIIVKQRRQRAVPLTLYELIYATLIAYPLYQLPHGVGLASVMQAIHYLANQPTVPTNNAKHRLMQMRLLAMNFLKTPFKLPFRVPFK